VRVLLYEGQHQRHLDRREPLHVLQARDTLGVGVEAGHRPEIPLDRQPVRLWQEATQREIAHLRVIGQRGFGWGWRHHVQSFH